MRMLHQFARTTDLYHGKWKLITKCQTETLAYMVSGIFKNENHETEAVGNDALLIKCGDAFQRAEAGAITLCS